MRNASESSPTIITLVNPSADELDELRDRFDLHPLIVDDLRTGRQQPKFERPGHRLYLSLWDINERSDDGESDLAMIFDEHLLLIVQRGPKKVLRDVRSALAGSGIVPVIDIAASGMADAIRSAHSEIEAITEPQPELRPYFARLEHDVIGVAHLAAAEHKALDAVVASLGGQPSTRRDGEPAD